MKSKGNRSRVLVSAHPAGEGSRCRYQMAYDAQYYFCLRRICVSQEEKKRKEKVSKEKERKRKERKEKGRKEKETKEKKRKEREKKEKKTKQKKGREKKTK